MSPPPLLPPAGTHDNQTAVGWWKQGAQVEEKALIRRYTGLSNDDVAYCFIQEAFKSCAHTAVVTMQAREGGRPRPGQAGPRGVSTQAGLEALQRAPLPARLDHSHKGRSSLSSLALLPSRLPQDIMRLDDTARMNTPGLAAGNWSWRVGGPDVWRQLASEQVQPPWLCPDGLSRRRRLRPAPACACCLLARSRLADDRLSFPLPPCRPSCGP